MRMPDFDFAEPETVEQACALLAEDPGGSVVFAGGTDILVYLKDGAKTHRRLVSLQRIDGLERIEIGADGSLRIGAMATVNQVARSAEVGDRFPGVKDAALSLAADQVRNQATVAGNLCMAVPSADMAPILVAHGATLQVASPDGGRSIPIRDFFVAPRETVLTASEVLVAIEVPPQPAGQGDASLRHGGRACLSLPIASAAAVLRVEGETVAHVAVALGSVAPTPVLAEAVARNLIGKPATGENLDAAAALARAAARPIDDLRGSKAFRLELVEVLTRRVLQRAAKRAQGVRS